MSIKFSTSLTEVFEYPSFDTASQFARDSLKSNSAVVGSLGKFHFNYPNNCVDVLKLFYCLQLILLINSQSALPESVVKKF